VLQHGKKTRSVWGAGGQPYLVHPQRGKKRPSSAPADAKKRRHPTLCTLCNRKGGGKERAKPEKGESNATTQRRARKKRSVPQYLAEHREKAAADLSSSGREGAGRECSLLYEGRGAAA